MNGNPPPIPSAPAQKSGLPTWVIVLIVIGIVGVIGIAVIGMLAAIAVPNFVRARETAQMNACINNLRQIDGAKQQWALENNKELTDTPTEDEVVTQLQDRWLPICPAGGSYTINPVGENPTCSVLKHRLTSTETIPPTKAMLEGSTYENHFFNFQVQIPEGWTIGNEQDFDRAVEVRNSGRRSDPKTTEEMEKVSHMLLFAMEKPFGTSAESNPSIVLTAVDVRSDPGIRNGKDYGLLIVKSLEQKGSTRKQLNEPFLAKLDSKEFYRMDFSVGLLDRTQHQAFFATIENRHALLLAVTADSETDVNQILTLAGFPQTKD